MGTKPRSAETKPEGAVNEPEEAGTKPGSAVAKPRDAVNEPEEAGTKPGSAVAKPRGAVTKPGSAGAKPRNRVTKSWRRIGIMEQGSEYMSYEFVNLSTEICRKFSRQSWAKALELAQLYGWRPLGTCPPPMYDFRQLNAEWDGRYWTNDGQIVKAEDALFLAAALEESLKDIPDVKAPTDWNSEFWWEDDLPEWLSPEEKAMIEENLQDGLLDIMGVHPLEFFAGDEKQYLKQLIKFCRSGSFEIL